MTLDIDHYRAAALQIVDPYHAAVRLSWRIADDTERRQVVEAAYREALGRLDKLRARYEALVDRERARLIAQAFTPWHGIPADRSGFEALVAELDKRIGDDATAAFRELDAARSRILQEPHGPLAVFRIAWQRGWRDLVALGRTPPFDERHFGRNGIDRLLDFEARAAECGPATFDLAPPVTLEAVVG